MKHLIKDGNIIMSGLPSHFTRENDEGFWGGYENRTDIHYEDGWRDEVIPEYDTDTEVLGDIYYDEASDSVTYTIIPVVLDLEVLRVLKHQEFDRILEREVIPLVTGAVIEKLALGEQIPKATKDLIEALRTRETEVRTLINSITDPIIMKNFPFNRTEIEQSKTALKQARKNI